MSSATKNWTEPAVCFGWAQQCGVLVEIEDDRVTKITGDRSHPVSAGFVCPKGAGAHVLQNEPSRIRAPLKRGVREGEWVRVETPVGGVRQQARLTDTLPGRVVHADRWW